MDYPSREPFFAHKAFRIMHKASVAAEIGRDAMCLIGVILHTEDAARYRGPVRFWNSQLVETLGFSKWDSFDRARRKAIDSGWLQYSGDGKRSAGVYFVTIPEQYKDVNESPMETTYCTIVNPENGYDAGYKAGYDAGIIEGMKRVQSGVQSGDEQGEPYIPNPNPKPIPEETQTTVQKPKRIRTSSDDPLFEEFWKAYPRRTSKGQARKAWATAIGKIDAETILVAADRYAKQTLGKDQQFVKHPATWLNGECWSDETLKPKERCPWYGLRGEELEKWARENVETV